MRKEIVLKRRKDINEKWTNLFSCTIDGQMKTEADTLERICLCLQGKLQWDP